MDWRQGDGVRDAERGAGWVSAGVAATLLLGCASPGPPHPPSLRLPEKVTRLQAERVGDEVRLSWVNPVKTTDGSGIRGAMTAVLCRDGARAGKPSRSVETPCLTVQRIAAGAGQAASAIEQLPQPLRTGPAKLLGYRVEMLNGSGRSAGASDAVYVAGGQAPLPVGVLTLTPRRQAVLLRWSAVPDGGSPGADAAMEVTRTLVATDAGPVTPGTRRAAEASGQQRKRAGALKSEGLGGLADRKHEDTGEVVLTDAGAGGAQPGRDRGGMVDNGVREGDHYVYVAQRVQRVTLDGHTLELRGAASPAAALVYHERIAPAAPGELVSVPGGGFGQPLEIDLSWDAGSEENLAGYYIYRRTAGGAFERLNQEPVAVPAYRDLAVEAGQQYSYRVTAVDRLGHESAPGGEVHESLRK